MTTPNPHQHARVRSALTITAFVATVLVLLSGLSPAGPERALASPSAADLGAHASSTVLADRGEEATFEPAPKPKPEPKVAPAPAPAARVVAAAAPAPAPPPPPPPPPPTALGTFTVTCYALDGTTASGHPVSSDVVAVDPDVIPLGTRIHIEGVGVRVARDTGSKVQGHRLDIWHPSSDWCRQFGVQQLAVTLA